MVTCSICGSGAVTKSLMAPAVRSARKSGLPAKPAPDAQPDAEPRPLATPTNQLEAALTALRKQVEANSDYVGKDFAAEARAIHEGEAPSRSIYGEARGDEARALIEDGVPVMPLPFRPIRKIN